ncbi:Trypsin [Tangfeifania diversioriginum]|uniref:Trypsin n=2 Tax=Tangfeifania diversioriginum TaxID=1168035 RepID=A0A1M6M8M6_9BACT|nr:Trypsin [Tangfeifania diversioriginum]
MSNAQAQLENSIFAIVQISYNVPGEESVIGGIRGTAFLINDSTVLTANHILNSKNYQPNPGFKFAQFWLLNRGKNLIIPLSKDYLKSIEEIDATIITLPESVKCSLIVSECSANLKDSIYNFGHIKDKMPITKAHWNNNLLVIDEYDLDKYVSDKTGTIIEIRKQTINYNDVKLNDITTLKPSFKGITGMSGGPLIRNNEVIGLMSFGFPADSDIKDSVFAISIDEIMVRLK